MTEVPERTTAIESPPEDRPANGGVLTHLATDLTLLGPEQVDKEVARIEKAADAYHRLMIAALRFTRPYDWVIMGKYPYLQGKGAMRLAKIGLRIGSLRSDDFTETWEGGEGNVECMVTAEWPRFGMEFTDIGSCNTLDKLWASEEEKSELSQLKLRAKGDDRIAKRALMGYVRKKAYANGITRAVTGLLGVRGLTLADLEQAGIIVGNVAANIPFDGGKAGAEPKRAPVRKAAEQATQGTPKDSEPATPMTLQELAVAPVGTKASIRATLVDWNQQHEKFYLVELEAGGIKLDSFKVWAPSTPDWFEVGLWVEAPVVVVSEYKGRRQMVAAEGIKQIAEAKQDAIG